MQVGDSNQWVDHLVSAHSALCPTTDQYHCGRSLCAKFKSRKDFKRHLESNKLHCQAHYLCRCGTPFPRKDKFRNHFKRQACETAASAKYVCACGYEVLPSLRNAASMLESHLDQCNKGKRGRPKKKKEGSCGEMDNCG
ncbi:hypothetical protein F4778DRAFT_761614 [Xylariomycetidae sp. FL2044]|nr:hypothetical protein F4778DRAFT_761614 [Xylariomycetidae sp. FL2044]